MKLGKRIRQSIDQATGSPVMELGNLRKLHVDDDNTFSCMGVHSPKHWIEQGYTPQQAFYVWGQQFVSIFVEEVTSLYSETEDYRKKHVKAEGEYMPSGPPMSPLTASYFSYWASFDLRFGKHSETMGRVVVELLDAYKATGWPRQVLEKMSASRLGVYEHVGFEDNRILLREFVTDRIFQCICPAGYTGEKGEIWLDRLLPPLLDTDPWLVAITPYVISHPKAAWDAYFERTLFRMRKPSLDEAYEKLMKQGENLHHWHEYIFLAFTHARRDAIFLTGVPDDPSSLPHAADC